MTTILIIYCVLIGLLGIAAQVLLKIISLKSKAKAGNTSFTLKSYFTDDWPTMVLSLVFVFACVLAIDEILNWKPAVVNYVKAGFFFVGYAGSSILNQVLNRTEKRIMSIIDTKTDIADNVTKTNTP